MTERDPENGQRIRAARQAAGFASQDAFADALGIASGRRAVSRWETGELYPSPASAAAIERVTGGRVTAGQIVRPDERELRESLEQRVDRLELDVADLRRQLSALGVTIRPVPGRGAARGKKVARLEAAAGAPDGVPDVLSDRRAPDSARSAPRARRRGRE